MSEYRHLLDALAVQAEPARSSFLDYALDWHELYSRIVTDGPDWLVEPFLATGRAHALYAPAKVGKSLLALYVAAGVATGRPVLDRPASEPEPVIYCDYEMTPADILERLEDMGYTDPAELKHLHYVQLPDVAALDTDGGGAALAADVERIGAVLVVIDTTGRALDGPENEADTYLGFYRHTGRRLKATGCAWVRLDHAGKDLGKGQRGTSAKNDDVDVVWQLTRSGDPGFRLRATHRRMGWVPATVPLQLDEEPALAFAVDRQGWPPGTAEKADVLDRVGIALDASVRVARRALAKAGESSSTEVLAAALKYRRSQRLLMAEPGGTVLVEQDF